MFNYNHLYYFHTVVCEGGISAAARKLSISQPALSAQIRQLEKFMGRKLFQREGKGIKPTEFGLMVFSHTQKMFETAFELMEQLSKRGDPKGQLLKIGVSDDLEKSWIDGLIREILKTASSAQDKFSTPQITYISGPHEALETKLRKGNIDVVFSFSGMEDKDLSLLENVEIPVMLGVPTSYALSEPEMEALNKNQLGSVFSREGWGLAVPSRSFRLRDETEKYLKNSRLVPHIVFEGEVLAAVTLAVETQQGAAFLPFPYMSKAMSEGLIKVLGPSAGFWRHQVFLMARQSDRDNFLVKRLKDGLGLIKEKIEKIQDVDAA
jgi:LysR family transcriptional activator of nhaA